MANTTTIQTAKLDQLFLDPRNPRLGRHNLEKNLSQDQVLDLMREWTLDELAVSFLESGFWRQEALVTVMEPLNKKSKEPVRVVVEGNRRLAALKLIARARDGQDTSSKWSEIIRDVQPEAFRRLVDIPFIEMPNRKAVQAYLGFRHVTGIKEWNPAEKAQFITHLIEDENLTYDQVRRRIGSKTPTVRQNYISYRLLLQMENDAEQVDIEKVEERFSVLYLSIRTDGVQKYLQIDIEADPEQARKPCPPKRLKQLANFALWLFGSQKQPPIIADSRNVDAFGKILESDQGVAYLERTERPVFETARRIAGVAESEVSEHIERSADELEAALGSAHQFRRDASARLLHAIKRVGQNAKQLLTLFPQLKIDLCGEDD